MVRPAGDAMVKFVFQSEMTLTLALPFPAFFLLPLIFQIELLVQEGGNEHDEGQAHERAHPVKLAEAGNVVAHGLEQRDAQQGRAPPCGTPGGPDVEPRGDQAQGEQAPGQGDGQVLRQAAAELDQQRMVPGAANPQEISMFIQMKSGWLRRCSGRDEEAESGTVAG